ncbi:DUF2909 family protein [Ferrimonas gelatinilytica]|uniref:DUF2909 family protein n=1 Tax=Ferrimonas gelatinilytica TaxID=1255257 RepID=A0ABP9S9P7_9GAMM
MIITLFKSAIVLLLLYILFNLGRAGVAMLRADQKADRPPMTRYLGRRVGLSALVLVLLILAIASGLVPVNPRPY